MRPHNDKVHYTLFMNPTTQSLRAAVNTSIERLSAFTAPQHTTDNNAAETYASLRRMSDSHPELLLPLFFLLVNVDNTLRELLCTATVHEQCIHLRDMCPHKARKFFPALHHAIDAWLQNERLQTSTLVRSIEDAYICA